MDMNKRGISSVVATILLILIAILAILIFWFLLRGFLKKSASGIETSCLTLDLKIEKAQINTSSDIFYVNIKRNPGAGNLSGIRFKIINSSESVLRDKSPGMVELETRIFSFDDVGNVSYIKRVDIAGIVSHNGEEKICRIADSKEIIGIYSSEQQPQEPPSQGCGDGSIDLGEDCEGIKLGGATCVSLGYDTGILSCYDNCTLNVTNCSNFDLTTNLVAYYKFENNVLDDTGINNGTNHGAVFVGGKIGKALKFNGSSDYVEVPNSNSLGIINEITITAWVKADSLHAAVNDIATKATSTDWRYANYRLGCLEDTRVIFVIGNEVASYNNIDSNVALGNNWKHIAAVANGSLMSLYINGSLDKSQPQTVSLAPNSATLRIGFVNGGVLNNHFNGTIDEVRIYNKALSSEEISALYRRG